MQLIDKSIGITDMLGFRECPRRFEFGMQRHGPDGDMPEAEWYYGSAFHDAVEYAEKEQCSDDKAILQAFNLHFHELQPEDLERLRRDMKTYRDREPDNVKLIANEHEFRIPLYVDEHGDTIYFRGRLDRVYQDRSDPTRFFHRDYKTSRTPKSQEDADKDLQMWAYAYAIHYEWPECEDLEQTLDQLQFSELVCSRKSPAQLEVIRDWMVNQVKAIVAYDKRGPDGLLEPRLNQWCGYCPIMESCSIVPRLTDFAKTRIATLAPEEKQGRKTVLELDRTRILEYVEQLEEVNLARKALERYEKGVKELMGELSDTELDAMGYRRQSRSTTTFSTQAKAEAHELLGERFYEAASLTQQGVRRALTGDMDLGDRVIDLATQGQGAESIQQKRK